MDSEPTLPMGPPLTALQGHVISHYRILDRLGSGGMGVVWKAEDIRLRRFVALKFLMERSPAWLARFQIEAQAVAALDHPAICGIYDIDQTSELTFLAMPFIDGESLGARIRRGALTPLEALRITRRIAEGLEAAHAKHIIHRDIKSSNVMLASTGEVKILDFGLARVHWAPVAEPGASGTPSYMSPEQVLGQPLDHRTDLWSLGVVLYEMITGKRPFTGADREKLVRALLHQPLGDIRSPLEALPPGLENIVRKLLAKSPDERYPSATTLLADLRSAGSDTHSSGAAGNPQEHIPSLVVLPLANLSSDPENQYFSDGLTDELINTLAQLHGLRVLSRTSSFAMTGKTEDVKRVGAILNVDFIMEGSVRKAGSRLRINVQLVRTGDGSQVWSQRYDRELDDVFAIHEDIALQVAQALRARLSRGETVVSAHRLTSSMEVYDLYLQGAYYMRQMTPTSMELARSYFEKALDQDPRYAPARAGIAWYHYQLGFYNIVPPRQALTQAMQSVLKALELDSNLPEAHRMMGEVLVDLSRDWTSAEAEFRKAIALRPGDADIRCSFALLLTKMRRFAEAHEQLRIALDADPVAPYLNAALAAVYYYQRDPERALQAIRKTLELDPNNFEAQGCLGLVHLEQKSFDVAVEAFQRARDLSGGHPLSLAFLGYALGSAGRRREAQEALDQLMQLAEGMYISPGYIAVLHIALEASDEALRWLERAYEACDSLLTFAHVLPVFDPLRDDPRFTSLVSKLGFPGNLQAKA